MFDASWKKLILFFLLFVCKCFADIPLDPGTVNCSTTSRVGGNWTIDNLHYQLYDITCTNNGTIPTTNITLTLNNTSQITNSWNLLPISTSDDVITYQLTNFNAIFPGRSFGGAGYIVNGSVPQISNISVSGVINFVEPPTPCSRLGVYFSLSIGKTTWENGKLNTLYIITIQNKKSSIVRHVSVNITSTEGAVVNNQQLVGMTNFQNNIYNITFSSGLMPGKSNSNYGFNLLGIGSASIHCVNIDLIAGAKVDHREKTIAFIIVALSVGTVLIIATFATIIIYLRRAKRKSYAPKSEHFDDRQSDYKYTKLTSF